MMRIVVARLVKFRERPRLTQARPFCSGNTDIVKTANSVEATKNAETSKNEYDPYRDVHNLDFSSSTTSNLASAARILLNRPAMKKKYRRTDFVVVQILIWCLPTLAAIFLGRRLRKRRLKLDKEQKEKDRIRDEAEGNAEKEMERRIIAAMKEESKSDPELQKIRERLTYLEQNIGADHKDGKK